jgi:ubiquinone/menaquinone biosynthesis C-methylase UbiE
LLFFTPPSNKPNLDNEQVSIFILLSGSGAFNRRDKVSPAVPVAKEGRVTNMVESNVPRGTTGLILHAAAFYDLTVWLAMFGRERAFREKVLQLARLKPGESVLDVGCGTGTLAIAAKRHVGTSGTVHGIDASPEMIARAEKKAGKAGAEVFFKNAAAQALPFPGAQFDAVLTTAMLHHLPRKARQQCAGEMRRVLKPGGRVLAVEFGLAAHEQKGFLAHFHRHGHVKLSDVIGLLSEVGLNIVESGSVGIRDLQFVLANVP